MSESKKKTQKNMRKYLNNQIKSGIVLFLDGEVTTPSKITSILVKEEITYMADYIFNDVGVITELHYNKVF